MPQPWQSTSIQCFRIRDGLAWLLAVDCFVDVVLRSIVLRLSLSGFRFAFKVSWSGAVKGFSLRAAPQEPSRIDKLFTLFGISLSHARP